MIECMIRKNEAFGSHSSIPSPLQKKKPGATFEGQKSQSTEASFSQVKHNKTDKIKQIMCFIKIG
jgi:hypothetical protein